MNEKNVMPLVGIVIPTWNLASDTEKCLNDLMNQEYPGIEITVVDNDSKDHTVEMIQKNYPQVHLIRNPTNLGFATACNIGMRHAKARGAEFIFLINNDTEIPANIIGLLVEYAGNHQESELFGTCIKPIPSGERLTKTRTNMYALWSNKKNKQSIDRSGPVDLIWGCGMLLRSQLLDVIGYFDPTFFAYDEDRDFCMRTRQAGYEIHLVAEAEVGHKISLSTGGLLKDSSFRAYLLGRNRVRLWKKHATKSNTLIYIVRGIILFLIAFCSRWLRRNPQASTAAMFGIFEGLISAPMSWPRFPKRFCDIEGIDPKKIARYIANVNCM